MSDNEGGFSFGVQPGDGGEEETIEVSGEPVSRSEAKNLGYVSLIKTQGKSSASSRARLQALPPNLDPEVAEKLLAAWDNLRLDRIDEAITFGQEAAFRAPDLMEPKLVIARCFAARRQHDKAYNVLAAIPEDKITPEALYYQGLCLSRLGKVKEALEVLKKSRAASTDDVSRKQANDLILNLQGEQSNCPVCGRKTLYDSMVEVEERLLCAACAKKAKLAAKQEAEEDGVEESRGSDTRRRRKIRRPLTRMEILMRFVFAGVLAASLGLGLFLLYEISPEWYAWLRDSIPVAGEFLPAPPYTPPPASQAGGQAAAAAGPAIPTLMFDSPEIFKAMVGFPVHRRLSVKGLPAGEASFQAQFSPPTGGDVQLDARTGSLVWTPAPDDGGKTFAVTLGAEAAGYKVIDQVSTVQVSRAPVFRRAGDWSGSDPSQAMFMSVSDLTGDGLPDLAMFSGRYWKGELAILKAGPDREFVEFAKTDLPGRPVGAGVVMAGEEKWLAMADYWNSRLRFFALRDNVISEMAFGIELPGRPILAAFHTESSVSAVLCQVGNSLRVLIYRQKGQVEYDKLGEWQVSMDYVWRRLIILPGEGERYTSVIAVGSDAARSLLYLEVGRKDPLTVRRDGVDGILIDAILNSKGDALYCLWEKNPEGDRLVSVIDVPFYLRQGDRPANAPPPPSNTVPNLAIEGPPPLAGLTACGFSGFGDDLLILGTGRFGAVFDAGGPNRTGEIFWWPLQAPARLFGWLEAVKWPEDKNSQVVFADMNGGVWLAGVPEK